MPTAKFKPRKAWCTVTNKGELVEVFQPEQTKAEVKRVIEMCYENDGGYIHIERVEIVRAGRRGR